MMRISLAFYCSILAVGSVWTQMSADAEEASAASNLRTDSVVAPHASEAAKPPNIIFILADDLGYGDLSISGNPFVKTSNLDELARHSILCTKGYAAYPICMPSRISVLTGKYSDRTGARMNVINRAAKLDQPWLPALLKTAGYATCAIGKWGLGDHFPNTIQPIGFDSWAITHPGGGEDRWDYTIHRPNGVKEASDHRYITDLVTDEAIKFIDQNSAKPFFLYLAEPAPHWPLQAPEEEITPFKNRSDINSGAAIVYAMVQHLDKKIGDLIAYLKKKGLYENTLIVFTSDNGPDFGTWFELKEERWNDALAGHKGEVWEGGIKVPVIVSWPAMFGEKPRFFNDVVDGVDWQPTLCAAAGVTAPAVPIDGVNLLPRFLGQSHEPTPARFWNFNIVRPLMVSNGAYREGDWKLVRPPIHEFNIWGKAKPGATPATYDPKHPGRTTFVFQPADLPLPDKLPDYQLFNLAQDPDEKKDLASQEPERLRKMVAAFERTYQDVESGPDNVDVIIPPGARRTPAEETQDLKTALPQQAATMQTPASK